MTVIVRDIQTGHSSRTDSQAVTVTDSEPRGRSCREWATWHGAPTPCRGAPGGDGLVGVRWAGTGRGGDLARRARGVGAGGGRGLKRGSAAAHWTAAAHGGGGGAREGGGLGWGVAARGRAAAGWGGGGVAGFQVTLEEIDSRLDLPSRPGGSRSHLLQCVHHL